MKCIKFVNSLTKIWQISYGDKFASKLLSLSLKSAINVTPSAKLKSDTFTEKP